MAWGAGEPLVMEDVKVDPPQRLEVRIRILFTSICHTDLSAWKGEVLTLHVLLLLLLLIISLLPISSLSFGQNEAQRAYPRILGHEAAG